MHNCVFVFIPIGITRALCTFHNYSCSHVCDKAYACIHISTSHTHEHMVPLEYSTYVWPYLTVLIHVCIIVLGNTVNGQIFAGLNFCVFRSSQEYCESFSMNIIYIIQALICIMVLFKSKAPRKFPVKK